jgi:elongator complex protein 2
MELTPEFVSLGVNRVVGALDWGDNGLVAYGGHHIVAIYDPEVCVARDTLDV